MFALVELLRGVAAFMVAPLLLHLAMTTGGNPLAGGQTAMWVAFGIAAGGGLLALYVFLLGRARLQRPDLEVWERRRRNRRGYSPPLGAGIRRERRPRHGSPEPARSLQR